MEVEKWAAVNVCFSLLFLHTHKNAQGGYLYNLALVILKM